MSSNGSLRNVQGGSVQFGLIKKSSAPPLSKAGSGPVRKAAAASVFRDALESSDDDDNDNDTTTTTTKDSDIKKANREIVRAAQAAASAKTEREKKKALDEDASIFDYDGAYDAMKEAEDAQRRKRDLGDVDAATGRKKPRYVENLLKASLNRKIELERVEDRKVAKERALEGDLFGDKDAFVTEAYKERQKELRRLEDEEKRKEALQRSGGDMAEFYRSLLDSHAELSTGANLTAEEIAAATAERERRAKEKELEEKEKLEEAIKRGELKINADNEIVDKRALLKGGLNISRTKIRTLNEEREQDEADRRRAAAEQRAKEREERERKHAEMEKRRAKEEQALRLLEETERQKREGNAKRAAEIAKEKEAVAASMARKATEDVVLDARARYLARKKAQEAKKDEDSD
ncbi:hypothetical protein HDU79_006425 [Rhizoclosmatium sp. JEL0117]|nr:hypothetical protein HDU79_006425 [Rhizoclosmatium sp. JEL0117]